MTTPVNLNTYVNWQKVLKNLNLSQATTVPTKVQCPFCSKTLYIYKDVLAPPDGRWYHCPSCNFTGDTIQLYQKGKEFSHISQAISNLVQCKLIDTKDINLAVTDDYMAIYDTNHTQARKFWEACINDELLSARSDYLALLASHGSYLGVHTISREQIQQLIGCADKREVNKHLLNRITPATTTLKGEQLVIGYQDAPGRYNCFQFWTHSGNRIKQLIYKVASYTLGGVATAKTSNPGLAFLDKINCEDTLLCAVNNPFIAANMHLNYQITANTAAPVVSFLDETKEAWKCIHAKTVYFWVPELTPAVVNNALQVENAYIFVDINTFNMPMKAVAKQIRAHLPIYFLDHLHRGSEPLLEVLRKHLFGLKSEAAYNFMRQIKMTDAQKDQLLSLRTASKAQINTLSSYTSVAQSSKSIDLFNKNIEERKDGYYVHPLDKPNDVKQISNFILTDLQLIKVEHTNTRYYCGYINQMGYKRPFKFQFKEQKSRRKYKNMLEANITDAYEQTLELDTKWESRLLDICSAFQAPKTNTVSGLAGWNTDRQQYEFPQFILRGDDTIALPCIEDEAPYADIYITTPEHTKPAITKQHYSSLMNNTPLNQTIWTFITVFLYNLINYRYKSFEFKDINFIVPDPSYNHVIQQELIELLNIPVYTFKHLTERQLNASQALKRQLNGVPLAITGVCTAAQYRKYRQQYELKKQSIIITIDALSALNTYFLQSSCIHIPYTKETLANIQKKAIKTIIPALLQLFHRHEQAAKTLTTTFTNICTYVLNIVKPQNEDAFNTMRKIIKKKYLGSLDSTLNGRRFLLLLAYLKYHDLFDITKPQKGITKCKDGSMAVNMRSLHKTLTSIGIDVPAIKYLMQWMHHEQKFKWAPEIHTVFFPPKALKAINNKYSTYITTHSLDLLPALS